MNPVQEQYAALQRSHAELTERVRIAEQAATTLAKLIPPPDKLRLLADYIDKLFPNDKNPEIQHDLRVWARSTTDEAVLIKHWAGVKHPYIPDYALFAHMLELGDPANKDKYSKETLQLALTDLTTQAGEIYARVDGHGQPCYYCGEPVNSLAANPSSWGVPMCHSDQPGFVQYHHVECIRKICGDAFDKPKAPPI